MNTAKKWFQILHLEARQARERVELCDYSPTKLSAIAELRELEADLKVCLDAAPDDISIVKFVRKLVDGQKITAEQQSKVN